MSEALLDSWAKFIQGHWQREMPTGPGRYPTANRVGNTTGSRVVYTHPTTHKPQGDRPWKGWWWSEPFPEMPRAPMWDDNPDAVITVCAECHRACCWQGVFMCEDSRNADVTKMSIVELRKLDLENEQYWKTDEELA